MLTVRVRNKGDALAACKRVIVEAEIRVLLREDLAVAIDKHQATLQQFITYRKEYADFLAQRHPFIRRHLALGTLSADRLVVCLDIVLAEFVRHQQLPRIQASKVPA